MTTDVPPFAPALGRGYRLAVDALPMSVRRRVRYYRTFGRLPDLRHPRTFTEKVTWRIVHDRRPLLRDTCDKARMKEHVARVAPSLVRVPLLRWQGRDVGELQDVELPEHWVLKPNHRSSLVVLGSGRPDVEELRARTQGWLEPVEWLRGGEWAYSQADASLIAEDRIGVPGEDLVDYKVYVFDGEPRLVQTDTDRFTGHGSRLYSTDWQLLSRFHPFPAGRDVPRPALLAEMLEAAAVIGAGFDFIRVDLYEHAGQVWFGELTPYPGSGLVGFDVPGFDLEIGGWWRLPPR